MKVIPYGDRDACKDVPGELSKMGTNESSYFGILLCKNTRKILLRMIGQGDPKSSPSTIFGSQFKLSTVKESR